MKKIFFWLVVLVLTFIGGWYCGTRGFTLTEINSLIFEKISKAKKEKAAKAETNAAASSRPQGNLYSLSRVLQFSLQDQTRFVAATILGEARGEGNDGMRAVANVIANRMKSRGLKAIEVCAQPQQFGVWSTAFSDEKMNSLLNENVEVTKVAMEFSTSLMQNDSIQDITDGATHYYSQLIIENEKDQPYWARGETPVKTIGKHVFYKLE